MKEVAPRVILAGGLILTLAAGLAPAQPGIGIGRTYAKLLSNNNADTRTRADPAVGVLYYLQLLSWVGFEPELWFTTKGTLLRGDYPRSALRYLEAPVSLRSWGATPGLYGIRPVLAAGLAPAVLLDCSWQAPRRQTRACADTAHSFNFRIPPTDVGAMLGVGVEMRSMSGWFLSLETRITLGLMDTDERSWNVRRNAVQSAVLTFRRRTRRPLAHLDRHRDVDR